MADDIKIIVRADVSSIRDAEKTLKRFEGASKTLGRSILDVAEKTKQVSSGWDRANDLYREGTLNANALKAAQTQLARELAVLNGYTTANGKLNTQRALAELRAAQAARDNAQATEEVARAAQQAADAHERTRQRYVAGAAAQARLREAQRDLSAAYRAGFINIEEYREALIRLNQQNRGNVRGTNNLGVAMQQTGYQVGDFVVQVQSGTNPMVAFGQQATQLVGIMYLLPQATLASTVGIGALRMSIGALAMSLGIVIPIATAIGAALLRMRKESKEASSAVSDLDNKIKFITSSLEDYAAAQRAISSGVTLEEYFLGLGLDKANQELKEARDNLEALKNFSEESLMGSYAKLGDVLLGLAGFGKANEYEQALKRVTEAEENLAALEEKQAKKRQEAYEDEMGAISQKITLLGAEQAFGKDSVQYLGAQVRQRIANYNYQVQTSDLTEMQKNMLIDLNTEMEQFNLELGLAALESERLANNLETAATFRTGGALGEFANVPTGLDAFGGAGDYEYDLPRTIRPTKTSATTAKTKADPLADLNKKIALDKKLLGVSRERQTVLRAIANSDRKYTQSSIDGAVKRLEAYNKEKEALEEAAAQQQFISDTIKDGMEDAFMSMVDGTKSAKDAFKDMARMIISELYKVLVVQQMVGNFSSGGGGILGALAPIFGRASGGTVMSNKPYLVGEKGPELIVPQNRGHVMNADLTSKAMGSGEQVVINQSFNFSANGDDSVKKLIAQAAPQIANLTQKQIMDSRRRGGTMKSTFG